MHKSDDEMFREIGRTLRDGESVSPTFDARVMAAVRALPRHRRLGLWGRINQPRPLVISPLSWGLAAAAMLMIAVLGGAGLSRVRGWVTGSGGEAQPHQFILAAPEAFSVAVVGDFNGWDPHHAAFQAHPKDGGLWEVTAPVPPGYHKYAYYVNDSMWVADPNAPKVQGNDPGYSNSAILIGANGQ